MTPNSAGMVEAENPQIKNGKKKVCKKATTYIKNSLKMQKEPLMFPIHEKEKNLWTIT